MNKRVYSKRNCPMCGSEHRNRGKTCSSTCAGKLRTRENALKDITCLLCGNVFHTLDGKGKYCHEAHFKDCEICKKSFKITVGKESKANPTCGPSCGAVFSHRSSNNKEIRRKNSLKKWGVEHPFQSPKVKVKIEKGLEGTAGRFGTEASKDAMKRIYGVDNASQISEVKRKKAATFKKNYTDKGIFPSYGPVSKINLRWKARLETATGLEWSLEEYFDGVGRVDLYTENRGVKIAVEINPTATHNAHYNLVSCYFHKCSKPCTIHTADKNQHFNRSKKLNELHGVSLTSVFDWMDEEKVISFVRSKLLLNSTKIYAKKTVLKEISQRDANIFLNKYHMLGASRKQYHCYGLFFNDELVQVQSFAPLGKTPGSFEAKRLVTKADYVVVGGVSKVTKHFLKTVQPKILVAYSDLNLSWPMYDLNYNGFTRTSVNRSQKCWSKGKRMILDKSAARQSADRLLGIANNSMESKYPESWTNEQVFLTEGWLPVWDCGMIRDELIIEI